MEKKQGERWHCLNAACRKEIVVEPGEGLESLPRCSCGSAMKKDYTPPAFRYLDFLELDETISASRGQRKG